MVNIESHKSTHLASLAEWNLAGFCGNFPATWILQLTFVELIADEVAGTFGCRVTYIARTDSVKLQTHQLVPRSIIVLCDVHHLPIGTVLCQSGVRAMNQNVITTTKKTKKSLLAADSSD